MSLMRRFRATLVRLIGVLLAVMALTASAAFGGRSSATGGPVPLPPGVAPLANPSVTCYSVGIVVAEIYAQWVTHLLPQSGNCWTTERPNQDGSTSFTLCNYQKQLKKGSGPSWVYDDTSANHSPSDQSLDNSACSGHVAYYAEWMARNGGYHWTFSPTYDIEEDYTSASHNNLSYLGSRTSETGAGTNSSFANIPGLDAAGSSIGSDITNNCRRVVIYSGTPTEYMIGLYNDTDPSSNEASIVSALNKCYG